MTRYPGCYPGLSYLNAFGATAQHTLILISTSQTRDLLFGRCLDRAIQLQAFEIDHLQLAGIVIGYEQRLAIRRVSELARKCAGRHTSKNRRWPGCDVRGINDCQGLASISVARKAVRVTY